jgi:hypothetical protein
MKSFILDPMHGLSYKYGLLEHVESNLVDKVCEILELLGKIPVYYPCWPTEESTAGLKQETSHTLTASTRIFWATVLHPLPTTL